MKKSSSVNVLLTLLLLVFAGITASSFLYPGKVLASEISDFIYSEVNENITITGYAGTETIVEIPSNIDGKPVKTIGYNAFREKSITSMTIPDSVTSIGNYAFYKCSKLESAIIPESVTSIGNYAFYGCSSLAGITLPDSITSIGSSSFNMCSSLTSITIPGSVTSISSNTFYGCSSLAEVVIREGTKVIGDSAFQGCGALTNVTIPETVTTIGVNTFYGCTSLTDITIPESVSTIGKGAFSDCSKLARVTILGNVNSIGENTFYKCISLANITIPRSVTSIVDKAFDGANPNLEISGYQGSYAETYAQDKSYKFNPLCLITIAQSQYGTATGSGTYNYGQSVTLGAVPKPGYNFNGWYAGETKISSLPNYTIFVMDDITLTPDFIKMPASYLEVTAVGGGSVTLNSETTSLPANYKCLHAKDAPIQLTATPDEGYVFAYWEDVRTSSIISTNSIYECIMGAGVSVKAVFYKNPTEASDAYTVVFKDISGKILQSANVAKGTEASPPPATPALTGYVFTGWDQDFSQVASNMIVSARYMRAPDAYTITVIGGEFSTGGTTGEFQFDMLVTVKADTAPAGQKFSHWEQDGVKVSSDSTYRFFAPMKATALAAVFVDENAPIIETPFIVLSNDVLMDTENKTMIFTANRYVPADYTLVESGMMLLNSNVPPADELTLETENALRGRIKNDSTDQFYVRKSNINTGDTWYARAYLIYQDASGNIITVYSENTVNIVMK
ncbi:MAG TPA: leucine-rich repeat protein [Clostridiales bacterium]|nr:leucine-rich repeat protein [Clostridiales bacterium]